MASSFKPNMPFNLAMRILAPTSKTIQGVRKDTFPPVEECPLFYGSFRTFGGTERDVNGAYTLENTATVDTWYRPDIKADCQVYVCDTGEYFEILGAPENIDMRNQYLRFKVRKVGGRP